MSDLKVATKIGENGEVSTNVDIKKETNVAKAQRITDSDIKNSMGLLSKTIEKGRETRKKCLHGSYDDKDILMDKMLWSLLEEILEALFRIKVQSQNFDKIRRELEENERLSKEYLATAMIKRLNENDNLSSERKEILTKQILSDDIQQGLQRIAQYSHNKNLETSKSVMQRVQRENPNISQEELAQAILKETDINIRANDTIKALITMDIQKEFETNKQTTLQVKTNEKASNLQGRLR